MKLSFKRPAIAMLLIAAAMGAMAQEKQTTPQKPSGAQKMSAADSMMNAMNATDKSTEPVVIFKSTRLVQQQTTQLIRAGNLNFLVIHRFGDLAGANGGGQTAFGLDRVNDVYIGFQYGISDDVNVDLGRSTIGQLAQLNLKYAVLHQTNDGSPFAITLIGEAGVKPYQGDGAFYPSLSSRMSYGLEAPIARKFSDWLSLQVIPTYVANNTPYPAGSEKSFFALQGAARLGINRHMGFIIDYAHPFSTFRSNNYNFQDPLGIGYEVETGGHVFTLNVSNSNAISDINYLSNTQQRWSRGQYRVGFTISRMFDLRGKGKSKEEPKGK
jgi:hypothetical protein